MRTVSVQNQTRVLRKPILAGYGSSFFTRLKGLMFTSPIALNAGLLLVQDRASRLDSSIHMFFVNYDLGVIWINDQMQVVDTCLAYRWRPFYMPAQPARYVLETHPDHLADFRIGDCIAFKDE